MDSISPLSFLCLCHQRTPIEYPGTYNGGYYSHMAWMPHFQIQALCQELCRDMNHPQDYHGPYSRSHSKALGRKSVFTHASATSSSFLYSLTHDDAQLAYCFSGFHPHLGSTPICLPRHHPGLASSLRLDVIVWFFCLLNLAHMLTSQP